MIAYGALVCDGNPATCPNMTVIIIVLISGWIIAHAEPTTVCLYRNATSRQARIKNNSR